ncbi:MAG: thiamine pyrophosphate-binding protein [Gallionella sp.]|nr:thiamine pyrophosphate-binding protein [Gallionella sp.]
MRLSDYVISFLEDQGIDCAFTVAGGGSAFLDDALRTAKRMRYVAHHHEQAAAMAAEAYARVRTGLGLAVVTSGPGGTNAITGVAGAWLDHVPLIVLSGQTFQKQTITGHPGLRTLGVQEINIVDIVKPITKYAVMVTEPKLIRAYLEHALHMARSGRPGPVWLDLPADVQNAQIDPATLRGFDVPARTVADGLPFAVAEVVRLLRAAKRPLVHVGQGVRLAGAVKEFFEFVESCGLPFVTARNANDICGSDHPNYIGRPGTFAQRGANFAVQTCDLYITIGTRLSLAQTGYQANDYARNAKIVMVDIDDAELSKGTVRIDWAVRADAGDFLRELLRQDAGAGAWSCWLAQCKAWQAKYPVVTPAMREPGAFVNSYHFIDVLSDLLTADDVIVTDMGSSFQHIHQAFKVKAGQRLMTNCGLAPMGWGLPAAVGACVGSGRRTICITGDGGFMFNSQELATIAHHKLPIKIFVLNNGGYLTMRESQANAFGGYMGSDEASGISFPDFKVLADANGLNYGYIGERLVPNGVIKKALEIDGPILVEVMMDPNQESMHAVNRRGADGAIKQTAIEDAFPFLDPAEVAENLTYSNIGTPSNAV